MRMKRVLALLTALPVVGILAQAPTKVPLNPAADKPLLAAVAKQAGANLQALLTYTYQQRVQVQINGEDKGTTLVEIAFGPDGKPLVTPMSSTPPQGRQRHGLRGDIQKSMEAEAKQEIDGLVKLAAGYTMLNPPKIQEMVQKAETLMIPAQNAIRLDVKSFLVAGDEANFKFDAASNRQRHAHVETSAGGNPVVIDAQFQNLPSGLTVCAQTMINVPAKGISITVNTFDYQK
jgi:hypothetical protein